MSFYRIFSIFICTFSLLVYGLRFFLVLYNRFRISFLEDDMALSCDNKEQHEEVPKEKLISILVNLSHADFILPLLQNIRKQNYKNIELIVAVSYTNEESSRSLKEAVITSHREYISHVPLFVFLGRNGVEENMHMLASASRGEYLCLLDQRTRLSQKSIASAMTMLLSRGVNVLSVIPNLLGSSKLLQSYASMTYVAFSMRRRLFYVPHATSDVFSLLCAGDYYKYFLYTKGYKKYMHDKGGQKLSDIKHGEFRHLQNVFSSAVTYHTFAPREYLSWFTDAFRCIFRNGKKSTLKNNHDRKRKNESETGVVTRCENYTELMALCYAMLFIIVYVIILLGVFIEIHSYVISYVGICIISFATHYACVQAYGVRLYEAVLQWLLSPIPYLHALGTLSLRVIGKAMHRHTNTSDTASTSLKIKG